MVSFDTMSNRDIIIVWAIRPPNSNNTRSDMNTRKSSSGMWARGGWVVALLWVIVAAAFVIIPFMVAVLTPLVNFTLVPGL